MNTEATFTEILPDGTTRSGPGSVWHNPTDHRVSMQIPASEAVAADPGLPQGKCRPCGWTATIDELGACTRCGWRAFQHACWLVRDKDGRVLHWPQPPNAPSCQPPLTHWSSVLMSDEQLVKPLSVAQFVPPPLLCRVMTAVQPLRAAQLPVPPKSVMRTVAPRSRPVQSFWTPAASSPIPNGAPDISVRVGNSQR